MRSMNWPAWVRPADIIDLLRLSVPIAISRMSMMLMSMTDAIVLGQFAPGQLPFVLNSWLPMGVTLGFSMGILIGVQVLTSEMLGIGRHAQSGRIFRRGLWAALALGFALMALVVMVAEPLFHWLFVEVAPHSDATNLVNPEYVAASTASVTRILAYVLPGFTISTVCGLYLEALRRPVLVAVISYGGVLLNIVLDLGFVGGFWGLPQMGAEGVAIATTGSRYAIALMMFVAVVFLTPAFRASPKSEPGEGRRQFEVGIGSAISNVAEWGGFNLTFTIATWISLSANTVYGYTIQLIGFCFMFYMGIASATSVRVAEAFGRGNRQEVVNAGRLGVAATLLTGITLGLLLAVFREPLSHLLVKEDAVIDGVLIAPAIASLMFLAGAMTLFDGLQATSSYALRAQEIVWSPSLIHIGSFFLVMLPTCYWFGIVQGHGARGMMEGALIGVFVAGTLQTLMLELKAARPLSGRAA
ncbi:MAG: multidrug transporter [Hyphomonadaceae bacterium BRH_c29]|jgi:MATE family, multidrug efflux pump|nr:MAG: multidrug transporter [Hyphomonadaceae bacterium BRH_c29]